MYSKSNFLAQGPKVAQFEQDLCEYTGAKYAVAFNSATSALQGAYSVCGIKENDEIITTPISFVATSNMFVSAWGKTYLVRCQARWKHRQESRSSPAVGTSRKLKP
ncbi:MAG: DegT/DnrJ/EryC1/StrS family aminotransferase [Sulfurimonas sp.]|nr:DegT/DnrJ/EryC1/StrS family aminotransferase [Sulfurimonas sp.]